MWVVVDHLSGSRRGQRQELEISARLTIGRHPKSEIGFDTRRDLEASTRHAELRVKSGELLLTDVGSSNGTYVAGERMHEVSLPAGEATEVEFGARGPRLRIWWDPIAGPEAGPPLPRPSALPKIAWVVAALVIVGLGVLATLILSPSG